ncbi:acyl-CoA dehydrogenase family protein [Nocardia sp. alder85J]|uniref:acyl-CoA dehydrogenase family protein n=1 Tax=Nocardia sp. alder85J TaxID=2862949 RepID=UPI001CD6AF5E|nr:acyl-CoA dehydrogenase family protein [Nocardia sp. alder85J]MCX4098581.1 acyl-CoA dehydrogenase [Nocardia sp. alder85J]
MGDGAVDVPGRLRELSQTGRLELPLPGGGETRRRLRALAAFGAEDTVLGRLAEAHTDAVAILHELGGPAPVPGQLWGVWAAEPPEPVLRARPTSPGWVLEGRKPWCSGAHLCTHALVTARTGTDRRLFAVPLTQPATTPVPDSWPAVGMRDSDSGAVDFDAAPAEPVGAPGAYLARPGFWHGAVGVAACWYGSACAVARPLRAYAASGRADEHALAHLGAIAAALQSARDELVRAAVEIDDDPAGDAAAARVRARIVRAVVEQAVTTTLDRVGRALGATPLCTDAAHARRVADLTVYIRQSHAEADLADLGRDLATTEPVWPDL